MALALPEPQLIDPFGGAADLAASVLRTPTGPHASFGDDPLRMMRAARFVAGYGLAPEEGLVAAVTEMRDRIDIVSPERITEDVIRGVAPDLAGPTFYGSGPEPMVKTLEAMLSDLGVPDAHVKRDYFPGYEWS